MNGLGVVASAARVCHTENVPGSLAVGPRDDAERKGVSGGPCIDSPAKRKRTKKGVKGSTHARLFVLCSPLESRAWHLTVVVVPPPNSTFSYRLSRPPRGK